MRNKGVTFSEMRHKGYIKTRQLKESPNNN